MRLLSNLVLLAIIPMAANACYLDPPAQSSDCADGKCDQDQVCSSPTTPWSDRFGNADDQYGYTAAIATDPCGDVVLAGSMFGTIDFNGCQIVGAGVLDGFVTRLDSQGRCLWAKQIGTPELEMVRDVGLDPAGDVLIAGYLGSVDLGGGAPDQPGFVAKLDASGAHLWTRGAPGVVITKAVAADGAGNVVVTGVCEGTTDFGGGPMVCKGGRGTFVVKLDSSGRHIWSRSFRGPSDLDDDQYGTGPESIAVDGQGNILLAGSFNVLDFGGGEVSSNGSRGAFVVKLDAAGNHLWTRTVAQGEDEFANDIAVDSSGSVLVAGSYLNPNDFYGLGRLITKGTDVAVVKFDPDGNVLWHRQFTDVSSLNEQFARGLVVDAAGNVSTTGWFSGAVDFGGGALSGHGAYDAFVVKLDRAGNHIASRIFGGPAADQGAAIAADGIDHVVVSGWFQGTIDLGTGPMTSAGSSDMYVAKLAL